MKKCFLSMITAGLLLTSVSYGAFSDVPETHWAYPAIEKMQQEEILSGYLDGTFKPSKNISLAEFASIFTKIFELPNIEETNYFPEIDETHWAKKSIETVRTYINPYYDSVGEALGVDKYSYMEGITGDLEMTREAFVYAVCKIYGYKESDYTIGEEKELFADYEEILFPEEIVLAYKNGVISGEVKDGKTYIKPARRITRAEASAIFRNLLKYEAKRVKNINQNIELKNATDNLISTIKGNDFEGVKERIYDTSNVLKNEYFTISEETSKLSKTVMDKYFDKFEYEIIETSFSGFNNGIVKIKVKGYDIKDKIKETFDKLTFKETSIDASIVEFLTEVSEDIKNKVITAQETEEVLNFVKQDGEWKLKI